MNLVKRVVIIEDQTAVRDMLAEILSADPAFEIVGECGDGQKACAVCLELDPDFIILDIMLPGLNGVDVLRRLQRELSRARVLIFSGHENPKVVREVLQAGGHGFVEKTASLVELKKGIKAVSEGQSYFGPAISAMLREFVLNPTSEDDGPETSPLTAREREVLQLIAESYSTKAIASKLSISVKTVGNHRTNLMQKLDLHNVAGLTRYAIEHGLVDRQSNGNYPDSR